MTTKTTAKPEVGTAVARKPLTFDGLLERMKPQIEAVLPKHLTPERMLALIAITATRTPKLKECTPLSLFNSIVTASRLGLEIGQHAHLVPFGNECVFIPDYRGLIHLAVSSGKVKHIDARVVYHGDGWDFELGDTPFIKHKPKLGNDRSNDNIRGFYAIALLADGSKVIGEPMTKLEMDGVRARSKAGRDGPWVTDYVAMGRKTVIKRICKFLPQTPELHAAIEADNRAETGQIGIVSDIIDSPASINEAVAAGTREKLESLKEEMGVGAAQADPPQTGVGTVKPASSPTTARKDDDEPPY